MIDHVSIGVRDVAEAKRFYDAALEPSGTVLSEGDGSLGYGGDSGRPGSTPPSGPYRADPTSGLHYCIGAPRRESVDRFHAAALRAGGSENRKPGLRADYGPELLCRFHRRSRGLRMGAYCGRPRGVASQLRPPPGARCRFPEPNCRLFHHSSRYPDRPKHVG